MAPIAVGEKLPNGTLQYLDEDGKVKDISIYDRAKGKKVVIFGVPGAFTPTCSLKHVPGFIKRADELKAKGVDDILCITVNDAFVVSEWAKTYDGNKHVLILADGSFKYTTALGLDIDLTERGMGIRSRRYAIFVDDLEVKLVNAEEGGEFSVSSADDVLKALEKYIL
eukprot:TRINITY_DN77_c0_g1_i1.p2 TRINITY_DN77_c0_g1~~TRINITY_DN77_c0_g1_i1.p2  ORF type:complete len:168 (-),score=29.19 TRINITY_DN77_c0_g1_i1:372-875(-)